MDFRRFGSLFPFQVLDLKVSVSKAEDLPVSRPFLPKRQPLRSDFAIKEFFNLTKIDRWFLMQIKEIVDFEEELATAKGFRNLQPIEPTPKFGMKRF